MCSAAVHRCAVYAFVNCHLTAQRDNVVDCSTVAATCQEAVFISWMLGVLWAVKKARCGDYVPVGFSINICQIFMKFCLVIDQA
jgi:hypothetical protein